MTPRITIVASLLVLVSTFTAGFYVSKSINPPRVETRIEYRDRVIKDTQATRQVKDVVKERTLTKPDGTVMTSILRIRGVNDQYTGHYDGERAQVAESVQVSKENVQYRVSLHMSPTDMKDVTVGAGRRLFGPLWLEATVRPKGWGATVGVGLEF